MSAATKKRTLQIVATRTLKMSHDVLCVRYSNSTDPSKLLVAASLLDNTVKIFYEDSLRFFLSLLSDNLTVENLFYGSLNDMKEEKENIMTHWLRSASSTRRREP